jgi:hypothetical protein
MTEIIGLGQGTTELARTDPQWTSLLSPGEKRDLLDKIDAREVKLKCVREHGGGENYVAPDAANGIYNVPKEKTFGKVLGGFMDDKDNLYFYAHLDDTHPDTQYINKVMDRHTDKVGEAPVKDRPKSRLGFSLGTDIARRGKGPILWKDIQHLGVTEDPLYHDRDKTRIFYRSSSSRDRDNYLRQHVLGKKNMYLPPNATKRLQDLDNVMRHTTVGASQGSESNLVTSVEPEIPPWLDGPVVQSPPPPIVDMAAAAPPKDPMQGVEPTAPVQNQVQAPASTPAPTQSPATPAAPSTNGATNLEYQQTLDAASKFVTAPELGDMSRADAVEKFVQLFEFQTKLEGLQEQLGKGLPSRQTQAEKDVMFNLGKHYREIAPKLKKEVAENKFLTEVRKEACKTAIDRNPAMDVEQLMSVHASALAMANQEAVERQLKLDRDAALKAAEDYKKQAAADMAAAIKKAQDEIAELRNQNATLTSMGASRGEKRAHEETTYVPPSTEGSLLKPSGTSAASPATASDPGAKSFSMGGFELPVQRFSMGASAGSVGVRELSGFREVGVPKQVTIRADLGRLDPFTANAQGLNMVRPHDLSEREKEHFALMERKTQQLEKLAIIQNTEGNHSFAARRYEPGM